MVGCFHVSQPLLEVSHPLPLMVHITLHQVLSLYLEEPNADTSAVSLDRKAYLERLRHLRGVQ
jgi:hypothetical protein